jgi:hypothetical protein
MVFLFQVDDIKTVTSVTYRSVPLRLRIRLWSMRRPSFIFAQNAASVRLQSNSIALVELYIKVFLKIKHKCRYRKVYIVDNSIEMARFPPGHHISKAARYL